jgi:hypothetical protein
MNPQETPGRLLVLAGAGADLLGVVPPARSWSRDRGGVSQDRDGSLQIQAHATERTPRRSMISAMHELRDHRLTGLPSDTAGYTSAYRSSYTVVYTKAKEVS